MAIEDVTGTVDDPEGKAQTTDASQTDADATDKGDKAPPEKESFIDPSELPEELKPHWKRMHRAYTKVMQGRKDLEEKAALVDRFGSDPNFALQTIQQAAAQMGYQLTKAQAAQVAATAAAEAGVPSELVEAVKARLTPELQWMAPQLAAGQWAGMQVALKPQQERQEADRKAQRESQFAELSEELTEAAPGWEEHEDEMNALLEFLRSDTMTHRKYGSKLKLLYNLATGNAAAVGEAIRRQGEAARARTTSGQAGRGAGPNIEKTVRDRKLTETEAWGKAAEFAVQELERHGMKPPR